MIAWNANMTIRCKLILSILLVSAVASASGKGKHLRTSAAAASPATPTVASTEKEAKSSADPGKNQSKTADSSSTAAKPANGGLSLDAVIKRMDETAASFKSAQADFEWEQYQKVVDETDVQKGVVYFRRAGGKDTQMMS